MNNIRQTLASRHSDESVDGSSSPWLPDEIPDASNLHRTVSEKQAPLKTLNLQNKAPFWNEASQVYQLDFGGRVTQESAKNFQIEHNSKQVNKKNKQTIWAGQNLFLNILYFEVSSFNR